MLSLRQGSVWPIRTVIAMSLDHLNNPLVCTHGVHILGPCDKCEIERLQITLEMTNSVLLTQAERNVRRSLKLLQRERVTKSWAFGVSRN
jgi:hypothetical protein